MTYGTAYFDLEAPPSIFELAVRALAEGNSLHATARIVQVDKDTVAAWLDRAAHQCWLVTLYHWQNLHVRECQLDELWSFVHTKEEHLATAKLWCQTYGDAWLWLAFAPQWRLVLAFVAGKRTQENANRLVQAWCKLGASLVQAWCKLGATGGGGDRCACALLYQ